MSKRDLFPPPPDGPPPKTVYVMSNGWHAGLVLPRADIPPEMGPACQDFADHRFVEVGWGAKGFYMARSIRPTLVLRTLCWPSPSVMHIVGFDEPPEQVFQNVELVEIQLSEAGFRNLCQCVGEALARDAAGQPIRLGRDCMASVSSTTPWAGITIPTRATSGRRGRCVLPVARSRRSMPRPRKMSCSRCAALAA